MRLEGKVSKDVKGKADERDAEVAREPFVLGMDRLSDMRPTFFIGLGGSGGRVVDVLARRLRREPSWDRFRDLIQFISIDTDAGDLQRLKASGQAVSNIHVSQKPARIKASRGQTPGVPRDERVCSWVHDWYNFRSAGAEGAGQIRLESRYSLFSQLNDQGVGNVGSILESRLSVALRALNAVSLPGVRFFIYGSLAGGTGSGANLTMAYLCQRLARRAGVPATAIEVYGTFFLPSFFRNQVGALLRDSINANGYAALKEIEHFMELRYAKAAPSGSASVGLEYVHDPGATRSTKILDIDRVDAPPFAWVYLVDQPEGKTIDAREMYKAVGEIALLQLFSPILVMQNSAMNNVMAQLQAEPCNGYFAPQYGAVGAAVLEFPREALVNYFARRLAIDAMERLVVGRGADQSAQKSAARSEDPDFRELSEPEQNRLLDLDFIDFIEHQAKREAASKKKGTFSQIKNLRPTEERNLMTELQQRLTRWHDEAKEAIDVGNVDGPSLSEENPSLDGFYRNLVNDFKNSTAALARKIRAVEHELVDGDVFGALFDGVSPLMQRYLLTHLSQLGLEIGGRMAADLPDDKERARALQWCLLPGEPGANDGFVALAHPLMDRVLFDPEMEEIRKRIREANRKMQDALRGFSMMPGAREKNFDEARASVMSQFNGDVIPNIQDALARQFWHDLTSILRKEVGRRLDVFRNTAKAALGAVDRLRAQAEASRKTGIPLMTIRDSFKAGKTKDAASVETNFHLGSEVLCDHRSGMRLWDDVFELSIVNRFDLGTDVLADRINAAIEGHANSRQATKTRVVGSDVLAEVLAAIDENLRSRMAAFLSADATGFDLLGALELEARVVVAKTGSRGNAPTSTSVDAVTTHEIATYVEDKISFVRGMSLPLSRIDRGLVAGASLQPFEPRYYGMPSMTGRGGAIGPGASNPTAVLEAIERGVDGFQAIKDWATPDVLTIFQGVLGLPLYAWVDVAEDLQESYEQESTRDRPTPLHTDRRYERTGFHGHTGLGLPDLSIVGRQMWDGRHKEEMEQRRKELILPIVVRLMAADLLVEDAGNYAIEFDGDRSDLGKGLSAALHNLLDQLSDDAIARAYLEAAGCPGEDRYTATTKKLNSLMLKAKMGKRVNDEAAAKALVAVVDRAQAL